MTRKPRRRGFTLFEVVVAGGILTMLLLMVAQLTTAAYQANTRTTEVVTNYRLAANTLHLLARELRSCQTFWWPKLSAAQIGADLPITTGRPLRFSFKGDTSRNRSVAAVYTFDASSGEIRRKLCDLGAFVADDPSTWDPLDGGEVEGHVVARGVNAFVASVVGRTPSLSHVRMRIDIKSGASMRESARADMTVIPVIIDVPVMSQ